MAVLLFFNVWCLSGMLNLGVRSDFKAFEHLVLSKLMISWPFYNFSMFGA